MSVDSRDVRAHSAGVMRRRGVYAAAALAAARSVVRRAYTGCSAPVPGLLLGENVEGARVAGSLLVGPISPLTHDQRLKPTISLRRLTGQRNRYLRVSASDARPTVLSKRDCRPRGVSISQSWSAAAAGATPYGPGSRPAPWSARLRHQSHIGPGGRLLRAASNRSSRCRHVHDAVLSVAFRRCATRRSAKARRFPVARCLAGVTAAPTPGPGHDDCGGSATATRTSSPPSNVI